jgi:hypothetical protein
MVQRVEFSPRAIHLAGYMIPHTQVFSGAHIIMPDLTFGPAAGSSPPRVL